MKTKSLFLFMIIALCYSAEAASNARFNSEFCKINQYANVGKYLGKSYKTLPKEILDAGSDFGNVQYHTFWAGEGSTLKYFNLPGKEVESIYFDEFKGQIISVSLYFSDQSIVDGVVNIDQIMNSCGKRVHKECSVHNKNVELINQDKNKIKIQHSREMTKMYGFPLKYSQPCASYTMPRADNK